MASANVITSMGNFYATLSCSEIFDGYALYGIPDAATRPSSSTPDCARNINATVSVRADPTAGPETARAMFKLTFGIAIWFALLIHAVALEIYLNLTPAEAEQLRMVSYGKQLEAGFKDPGRAGFAVNRFDDSAR